MFIIKSIEMTQVDTLTPNVINNDHREQLILLGSLERILSYMRDKFISHLKR